MEDVNFLLNKIENFTQYLKKNVNRKFLGPFKNADIKEYLSNINELSFCIRGIDDSMYQDLQWIKQNMFLGFNAVNVFALGRLDQILHMNIFSVQKGSIWMYAHPVLREKCQKKFTDGHYADAVSTGFKVIISRVRKFRADNGHDEMLSDSAMMENTFKRDNPLLLFTACSTTSENNVHNGYTKMLIGAVQAIRNPVAHDPIEMTEDDAARKLMLASDLMYKLDEAFEQFSI